MKLAVPARIVASAALAVVALTGCSFAADITTSDPYAASDGIQTELGDVTALNLLVITEAEGGPAALIGSFYNAADDDVTVTVTLGAQATEVAVPADSTIALGTSEGQTEVLGTAPAAPGLIAQVSMEAPGAGTAVVDVPVMDGTLAEYAEVLENLG